MKSTPVQPQPLTNVTNLHYQQNTYKRKHRSSVELISDNNKQNKIDLCHAVGRDEQISDDVLYELLGQHESIQPAPSIHHNHNIISNTGDQSSVQESDLLDFLHDIESNDRINDTSAPYITINCNITECNYMSHQYSVQCTTNNIYQSINQQHGTQLTTGVFNVQLCHQWCEDKLKKCDNINLVIHCTHINQLPNITLSTQHKNMLIQHPTRLVRPTLIASSYPCIRRSILDEKHNNIYGEMSWYALRGTIAHELVDALLMKNHQPITIDCIHQKINEITYNNINLLYGCKQTEMELQQYLTSLIPHIQQFISQYVTSKIYNIIDCEENIYCTTYGIKGKIDCTVLDNNNTIQPLELKTGRQQYISHHAQVLIYILLLSDRYHTEYNDGLLLYIHDGGNKHIHHRTNQWGNSEPNQPILQRLPVANKYNELCSLIRQRNTIASYLNNNHQSYNNHNRSVTGDIEDIYNQVSHQLPPVLDSSYQSECQRCFSRIKCTLYRSTFQDNPAHQHTVHINDNVLQLTDTEIQYFKYWVSMIELESCDALRHHKLDYNDNIHKRIESNRCIIDLTLRSYDTPKNSNATIIFHYQSGSMCPMELNSYISVSIQQCNVLQTPHYNICNGYIDSIDDQNELIAIKLNQSHIPHIIKHKQLHYSHVLYRIDIDEYNSSGSLAKENITKLLIDAEYNTNVRQSIVYLRKPIFDAVNDIRSMIPPSLIDQYNNQLNQSQQSAVQSVLTMQDYSIIQGIHRQSNHCIYVCAN